MTFAVGVLIGALVLLATSGLLFAALLRLESVTAALLAAYAIAWAELTILTVALSLPRDLTRTTCLAGLVVGAGVAFGLWVVAGRPPVVSLRLIVRLGRDALRDPLLAVLAVGVLLALIYIVVIGIATPQNDADSLAYHLPRAAFWKQQHAVAYINGTIDSRENANPPVAEIGILLTMLAARSDKFAWLPQFVSLLACALAVFGIGRRLRLEPREAMFGALLFLSLPVSLLQAATALSDVVVAAFLLITVYFLLGTAKRELALAGLALMLALATKVSALFALPLLALLVLRYQPKSRWRAISIAAPLAALVGGGWYILNRVETGSFAGGLFFYGRDGAHRIPPHFYERLFALRRGMAPGALGLDIAELPGAVGRDKLSFVLAALLVAAGLGIVAWRRHARAGSGDGWLVAGLAGLLALTPLVVPTVAHLERRVWEKVWWLAGRRDIAYLDTGRSVTEASPNFSWFGPLGFLLGVVGAWFVARELRRRGSGSLGIVFVVAPFVWLLIVGWWIGYVPFDGRYFIVPFGLAAACWGALARYRAVVASAVAIALTTMLLVLVHFEDKRTGIRLLAPVRGSVIWHQSRGTAESGPGDEASVIDFVNRHVPADAVIAFQDDPTFLRYPFFGPDVQRTLLFGIAASEARADTIVFAHGAPHVSCPSCWRVAVRYPSGWGVLRRV